MTNSTYLVARSLANPAAPNMIEKIELEKRNKTPVNMKMEVSWMHHSHLIGKLE